MAKSSNRVELDGYAFLSPSEADFYLKVKQAKKEGKIKDFEIAPKYELQPSFHNWEGKKIESIDHYPDFLIARLDGSTYVIDTKGGSANNHEKDSLLKRKIWLYQNQGIPYYHVSLAPKYLGGEWTESTSGNDFTQKLRLTYKKELYPHIKKITASSPRITEKQVSEYFEWEYMDGLFYRMIKKYTKKEREKMAKEAK